MILSQFLASYRLTEGDDQTGPSVAGVGESLVEVRRIFMSGGTSQESGVFEQRKPAIPCSTALTELPEPAPHT